LLQAISDHQQCWGYEESPWKEPGPSLLVIAILSHNSNFFVIFLQQIYMLLGHILKPDFASWILQDSVIK
jgi:hypothetical protein